MLDLKIFLFENKLSFIFKNFSFDLLLQSNFWKFSKIWLIFAIRFWFIES